MFGNGSKFVPGRKETLRFHYKSRSKFKAPETPPPHGLTGFAAIKQGAEKRWFSKRGRPAETALRPDSERPPKSGLGTAKAASLAGANQKSADSGGRTASSGAGADWIADTGSGKVRFRFKTEANPSPENASIARFDGLGRY